MSADTSATAPPAASPPRKRRVLRWLAGGVAGLLALLLALTAALWWWLGSSHSLAFAMEHAARYLPAGQQLQVSGVRGSLRAGGRIGRLYWQSKTLAVEAHDLRLGWRLRPLLRRQLQLSELQAAQVRVQRRGPPSSQAPTPLDGLTLPLAVDLPLRIGELDWDGPPTVQAHNLRAHYRYADARHQFTLEGVDLADGHYRGQVQLQGPAPMALEVALDGLVQAPVSAGRTMGVQAHATLTGPLAGPGARLRLSAQLQPAEPGATDASSMPIAAQMTATLAPWQPQPVIEARAELQNVDLAPFFADAPRTRLNGTVRAGPDPAGGPDGWQLRIDLDNALPGPWDQAHLPLQELQANVLYGGGRWQIPEAELRAGHGRIAAQGEWRPSPEPWQVRLSIDGVRPGELHTRLAGAPVSGRASAEQRGSVLAFDLALQAAGGAGSNAFPGLGLKRVQAQGQWQTELQALDLGTLRVEAEGARLDGQMHWRQAERAGDGRLDLAVPGATGQARAQVAPTQGSGDLQFHINDAAALQRWLQALPGLGALTGGAGAQGNAQLEAHWQGGWENLQRRLQAPDQPLPRGRSEPTLQATLSVPSLALQPPAAGAARPAPLQLRGMQATLSGSVAQATLALHGEAANGAGTLQLEAHASGGLEGAGQWRASLARLHLQARDSASPGLWSLDTGGPIAATLHTGAGGRLDLEASAGGATLHGPVPGTVTLDWQPLRFGVSGTDTARAYRLQWKGRLQGLPLAWAEAWSRGSLTNLGVSGDLLLDGAWDVDAGDRLHADLRLARRSGDLRVQAGEAALVTRVHSWGTGTASERTLNAAAEGQGTPAGLRQAELRLQAQDEAVRAELVWDSERAGEVHAEASTRLQHQAAGWRWPADAPLAGRIQARLPNLGVWSMLAPPGWRIAGTLDADATLSGSLAQPRWSGRLSADQLGVRAPVEGLNLSGGRLRATLAGDHVDLTEFTLQGGPASTVRIGGLGGNLSTAQSEAEHDGGRLSVQGQLRWDAAAPGTGSGIRMDLQAKLQRLRLLVRSDRQIALTGALQAQLAQGRFSLHGDVKVDRAVIILADETAPSLGSDVVVHSAAKAAEARATAERENARDEARAAPAQTTQPPELAIGLDLGDDFAVQGLGLTTRLAGKLELRGDSLTALPRVTGELRTVHGQYRAYGQQLDAETGIARFNGPANNPQLDILAIRPNITQRAGVQITGTAQSPRVRLYSDPPLSDAETLAWVVLGRASAQGGAESLLLQQAALAMLGGLGTRGSGGSLASRFGLDEIGFKGPDSGGDVRDAAVTVGKRLSDAFYITYERSLNSAFGTLYIFYDLTRRLTLRGQAGAQSGVDLIYTVKFN